LAAPVVIELGVKTSKAICSFSMQHPKVIEDVFNQ
jgi:hypothetical protein